MKKFSYAIAAAAVATVAVTSTATDTPAGAAAPSAVDVSEHPLDHVPGWGRSPAAGLRDDTTALYESWQVEVRIADCLTQTDFPYVPELAMPSQLTLGVAQSLGVAPIEDGQPLPRDVNDATAAALTDADRDAAAVTKWGSEAASASDTHGHGEADYDGPAVQGCVGAARDDVGSVWNLRRAMFHDVTEAMHDVTQTAAFAEARQPFDVCASTAGAAVTNPGDLEEAVMAGRVTVDAADGCMQLWNQVRQATAHLALAGVVERWAPSIAEQIDRYSAMPAAAAADSTFLTWLGRVVAHLDNGASIHD
jgi:hypothetical protein